MPAEAAQHVAGLEVLVDGAELAPEIRDNVLEVRVRDSLSVPASAMIRINDPKAANVDSHPLQLGKTLEIKMGGLSQATTESVFKGEIVSIEPDFTREGCTISIRAYDVSHRLQRTSKVRTFQQVSARQHGQQGLPGGGARRASAERTGFVYKFFQQSGETDRDFIRRLRARLRLRVRRRGRPVQVPQGRPGQRRTGRARRYGDNLLSFRPRVSAVQQVQETEVRGWDPMDKREIVSQRRSAPDLLQALDHTRAGRGRVPAPQGARRRPHGRDRATSDEDGGGRARPPGGLVHRGRGRVHGQPAIRAGKSVKIDEVGSKFGGTYYVSASQHVYRGRRATRPPSRSAAAPRAGCWTSCTRRRSATGARNLVVGLVTNVNDPDSLGRVRVKFPTLPADGGAAEGNWARIATSRPATPAA